MSNITSLHQLLATDDWNLTEIKEFLQRDSSSINTLDDYSRSPLLIVLRDYRRSNDLVRLLIRFGADVNGGSRFQTPLFYALRFSTGDGIVRLLLEAGANVNDPRKYYDNSTLCSEASNIKMLLSAGASLRACKRHTSPFFCALKASTNSIVTANIVKLLLNAGASAYGVDEYDRTPLQLALIQKYETEAIRLLFNALNANPNTVWCIQNDSLLHLTVMNEHYKLGVVKFLLERGAQVHQLNLRGQTALHVAASNCQCQPSLVNLLVKHGSDVNAVDILGRTPLKVAVRTQQNTGILQSLLAAGARFALLDELGDCLLQLVLDGYHAAQERLDCFKLLLKYYLLQNPSLNVHGLLQGDQDFETLSSFAHDCLRELQEMESKFVSQDRSLLEFCSGHSVPQVNAAELDPENYEVFNWLLREVPESAFPIYIDVISTKVRRSSMKTKLEGLPLCAIKQCSDLASVERKVILDYESASAIANYLSNNDLLRLIFCFYNAGNSAHGSRSANVSKKKNMDFKRSLQQSVKFPKRPRLKR